MYFQSPDDVTTWDDPRDDLETYLKIYAEAENYINAAKKSKQSKKKKKSSSDD
jgi:hypothetical protein